MNSTSLFHPEDEGVRDTLPNWLRIAWCILLYLLLHRSCYHAKTFQSRPDTLPDCIRVGPINDDVYEKEPDSAKKCSQCPTPALFPSQVGEKMQGHRSKVPKVQLSRNMALVRWCRWPSHAESAWGPRPPHSICARWPCLGLSSGKLLNRFPITLLNRVIQMQKGYGNIAYTSDRHIARLVSIISTFNAVALLIGAIASLYAVSSSKTKLVIIAIFTSLFAINVGLLTNARHAELFGASAA